MGLLPLNMLVGIVLRLQLNERPYAVTNGNQAFDSVLGCCGYVHKCHTRVFSEINLIFIDREGEVPNTWVCRYGSVLLGKFLVDFIIGDLTVNV